MLSVTWDLLYLPVTDTPYGGSQKLAEIGFVTHL
jgi:hypothetical protein